MKFLLKNLIRSSFICFLIAVTIEFLWQYLINQETKNGGEISIFSRFLIPGFFLAYWLFFWPLIQTFLMIRFYGFKSLVIRLFTYILLSASMPMGWAGFFGIFKFFTGESSTNITLASEFGMYLCILFTQFSLFFLFVKDSHIEKK